MIKQYIGHLVIFALIANITFSAQAKSKKALTTLNDVTYTFEPAKLKEAQDSFLFLRSFVDYFYLVYSANTDKLTTMKSMAQTQGWCVGDAHLENFGSLVQEDSSAVFTMNDMDDSGPCPVGLDLIRLIVSAKLYDSQMPSQQIFNAYLAGLQNADVKSPKTVKDILDQAAKDGKAINSKKISQNKFIRTADTTEVSESIKSEIEVALQKNLTILPKGSKILDIVSQSKAGGGSGGLLRYEVLVDQTQNKLLHIELKQQVKSAIYPVAYNLPDTQSRITETVKFVQGGAASKVYDVVQINKIDMLVRPKFKGDKGITLDNQGLSENINIAIYEAYVLGQIHSRSVKNLPAWIDLIKKVKFANLNNDLNLLVNFLNQKYKTLTTTASFSISVQGVASVQKVLQFPLPRHWLFQ